MERENTNIHVLELNSYMRPEIIEEARNEWVTFGEDNSGYNEIIDRFKGSTTNGAIINNVSRLCYGRGLDALDSSKKPNDFAVMKTLFKPNMLRSAFLNEYMLGTGYLQVIYNKNHTAITRVETVKTKHVAPEKCNKDGIIEGYFYSDNWENTREFPPVRYAAFGTSKNDIEILPFGKESIDLKYFSEVDFQAALPYALLEEEIANYLINNTQNRFSAGKIINFNNGAPTEEAQSQITKKVKDQLTGANGDQIIIAFNNNADSRTTVEDISLDDAPDLYNMLATEARNKILNGHCVISPFLVGISPDGSGFSSSADEIKQATTTYYNQTIRPHQELLIDALDSILAFNGISLKLHFKNLDLLNVIGEDKETEEVETTVKMSSWLDAFGEDESEDWELIDSRAVDYDNENDFDAQIAAMEDKLRKTSLLQKAVNFASGIASPNKASSQDKEIDGSFFKIRYKYAGNPSPERGFCKDVMKASKMYRKEDIQRMSKAGVNKSLGHEGEPYDLFIFKGGKACKHYWERHTFLSTTKKASIGSVKTKEIEQIKAAGFGYVVNNNPLVGVKPHDMPNKGAYPKS